MKRKTLTALIAANLALATLLGWLTLSPEANAQPVRARAGDYIMVSAERQGSSWDTVWILDLNNEAILAIEPNPSRKTLVPVDFHLMAADLAQQRQDR